MYHIFQFFSILQHESIRAATNDYFDNRLVGRLFLINQIKGIYALFHILPNAVLQTDVVTECYKLYI